MKLIEDTFEIEIKKNIIVHNNFIHRSFEYGLNNMKQNIQCIFLEENWINWKVLYFSKIIKYLFIMKNGTESDNKVNKSKYNNKRTKYNQFMIYFSNFRSIVYN